MCSIQFASLSRQGDPCTVYREITIHGGMAQTNNEPSGFQTLEANRKWMLQVYIGVIYIQESYLVVLIMTYLVMVACVETVLLNSNTYWLHASEIKGTS